MTLDPRVWIAAGALTAAAAGGWFVNGWRLGADIERLQAVHNGMIAAANATTLAAVRAEQGRYTKRVNDQAQIDAQRTKELNDANKELERVRRGVADGSIGLRINATCPRVAPSVQGATTAPGLGDGTAPELTADARQDYFTLRQGIVTLTKQLEAAQDLLRSNGQ